MYDRRTSVPLTVRLPLRIEQELAEYCVKRHITKSSAVKQALERLLAETSRDRSAYELGRQGFGADRSGPADVARHTKQLLRDRFRGKAAR